MRLLAVLRWIYWFLLLSCRQSGASRSTPSVTSVYYRGGELPGGKTSPPPPSWVSPINAVYLFPGQTDGRPRERFYVSDFVGATIDGNRVKQLARRAGVEEIDTLVVGPGRGTGDFREPGGDAGA